MITTKILRHIFSWHGSILTQTEKLVKYWYITLAGKGAETYKLFLHFLIYFYIFNFNCRIFVDNQLLLLGWIKETSSKQWAVGILFIFFYDYYLFIFFYFFFWMTIWEWVGLLKNFLEVYRFHGRGPIIHILFLSTVKQGRKFIWSQNTRKKILMEGHKTFSIAYGPQKEWESQPD